MTATYPYPDNSIPLIICYPSPLLINNFSLFIPPPFPLLCPHSLMFVWSATNSILQLDRDDPVRRIYEEQISLPFEKNWGNHTKSLMLMYGLQELDPSSMSCDAWKHRVKTTVSEFVFQKLTHEASCKSKTKHLKYSKFDLQPYMDHYNPKTVSTIAKIRSRNVECKTNRKSSSDNLQCRLCNQEEETQQHIVNCSKILSAEDPELDLTPIMTGDVELNSPDVIEVCRRISLFHDKASNQQEP